MTRSLMDTRVLDFYREIFTDLQVDQDEAQQLVDFFSNLNPPPDKLVWLRATAFRIGCEFLSEDENDTNIAILRAINAIIHSLEQTCMTARLPDGNSEFDADKVTEFYTGLYDDLKVDREENDELYEFFRDNIPPEDDLLHMRATAFKSAVEYLRLAADEEEEGSARKANVSLLRAVNVIVHAYETTCLLNKDYELKLGEDITFDLEVDLNDAIQQLWNLDLNRLTPNEDYVINIQGGKKPYWKEDNAEDPLFDSIDKNALKRPTYKSFVALLDNYNADTGEEEHVTNIERQEIWTFLKAIMQTAPMQFCHKYLQTKLPDDVPEDTSEFLQLLHTIWFKLYSRKHRGRLDSSGFEHVFIGEIKNETEVSGFHNWIQFYLEEQNGSLDYRGYLKPKRCNQEEAETNSDDQFLSVQFHWNGVEKFASSMFIGVSPEFEMALYTICFLIGEEDTTLTLNTGTDIFELQIKCFKMAGDKIGTSFPVAVSHYEGEE